MRPTWIPVWKHAPFLRLLMPVIAGILLQWYIQFELQQILLAAICFFVAFIAFQLLPLALRFKLQALQGFVIILILMVLGLFITYQKDIRNNQAWFGNVYHDSDYIIATINEPLIEKNKSYKAESLVENVLHNDSINSTKGKIIIYFEKDSVNTTALKYGDKILISKKLQQIKNSGNPGAFDYQRYLTFRQIFHNLFLKKVDWIMLDEKNINPFKQFLFTARQNVLNILQKNMQGHDDQLAIAEALLIGYTQDLDKDLVQAYSNTGVVHIIAISGMHLGLIYVMLVWLFNKIPFVKRSKIVKVTLILSCLWLFTLLTGGSASILRAAVMFSCIVIGKNFSRRASIYNALAASAFILLCYNPYFLWDVGFQLSYLAVVGIVIFQKPIYHLLYIKNNWLNKIWQLVTVTLAAQILTFPVCLYYFHQFPTLFLFTNILLVPLSSLILFVEIFLVAFSWIPFVGIYAGKFAWRLIWLMNKIILWFNSLPISVWDAISISVVSTFLLYGFVVSMGYWLLNKNKSAFKFSLLALLAFTVLTGYTKLKRLKQQKLIVYNVPQHQSIDFIKGNTYKFVGDSVLLADGMLQNFHLKPGRVLLQLNKRGDLLPALYQNGNFCQFNNKKILLIDNSIVFQPAEQKINVDYIIISKNPKLYIPQLLQVFNCHLYIFDSSNPSWKIAKWKKDCEELHLRCYSVPDQGAFVIDL
ncbi:MAG TPA: ComEC/Rec2 family competence protein [Chitinophagaceae bacterium]|nr:ComEC/Rec2 family competence protein [Chitinophagaceae bacterium]